MIIESEPDFSPNRPDVAQVLVDRHTIRHRRPGGQEHHEEVASHRNVG